MFSNYIDNFFFFLLCSRPLFILLPFVCLCLANNNRLGGGRVSGNSLFVPIYQFTIFVAIAG